MDPGDDRRVVRPQRGGVVAVQADAGRRQVVPGHRPSTRHRHGVAHRPDAQRLGPPPQSIDREGGHAPERDGVAVTPQIGERRLLQGGQHQTARPQGPAQRVAGAGGHHVGPARDHPRLGPAEQLVTRERHRHGSGCQRLSGRRLPCQPRRGPSGQPRRGRVQQARPDVGHDRRPEADETGHVDRLGEPHDPVVRLVHLQHQAHAVVAARVDRGPVVSQPGAIGRADLHQTGARLGHHLGHPETPADLDQLAAGHDDGPVPGQGGQHQQQGGGPVVHHVGGLGPAGPGQQGGGVVAPRRPPARRQVDLQVGVAAGADRSGAEGRPAEVGVEQHPGGVDHRPQQGGGHRLGPRPGRRRIPGRDGRPGGVDQQGVRQADVGQLTGQGVD